MNHTTSPTIDHQPTVTRCRFDDHPILDNETCPFGPHDAHTVTLSARRLTLIGEEINGALNILDGKESRTFDLPDGGEVDLLILQLEAAQHLLRKALTGQVAQ
ncbi:hypothetical protein [Amycolatopsis sp. DSM 110486]|uniref:hypothetical protein n=1 Tax=Amycolatopsis sp. DSM 110486 TaxID=2865832 RepID=UPI001C69E55D|nr:hypothetical protein [Amycolatopsis sp. DSM 110486]QYN17571.1 hypothetical protein K1T34_32825 [Amycolatopsis sp. DSM 110486]